MLKGTLCIVLVVVICQVTFASPYTKILEIDEDEGTQFRRNRLLGTVRELFPIVSNLRFIMQVTSSRNSLAQYLYVDPNKGNILTNRTLDRDEMCKTIRECCSNHLTCIINFKIRVLDTNDPDNVKQVKVQLNIKDLNDHEPRFRLSEYSKQISENIDIGKMIPLDIAEDVDSDPNSIISYEVQNTESYFKIINTKVDNTVFPYLSIMRDIDRERVDSFQIKLIAKDGGIPPKTGETLLKITIADLNDEMPTFEKEKETVHIKEDFPVNKPFIKLTAIDNDLATSSNSKIRYRLRKSNVALLESQFSINEYTGELRLVKKLDYEQETMHVIIVEAVDRNGIYSDGIPILTGSTTVSILVEDCNDEAPIITITPAKQNKFGLSVPEDVKANSLIAWVTVSDRDKGLDGSGQVFCQLYGNDKFRLILRNSDDNEYEIRTLHPLDSETAPFEQMILNCSDKGHPPLYTTQTIKIIVENLNDNAPTFGKDNMELLVRENLLKDHLIYTFNATDLDDSRRDAVEYFLEEVSDNYYFRLDQVSGRLYSKISFDREQNQEFQIKVYAQDKGEPPRRSRILDVKITVQDVNDNSPIFSQTSYDFQVRENQERGEIVGIVKAHDLDEGVNGKIRYFIGDYSARTTFKIDSDDGRISTMQRLDREQKDRYAFTVRAEDCGHPNRLTTAQVIIEILDENDNAPRFIFPSNGNRSLSTSYRNGPHFLIAEVLAKDQDKGQNAVILFFITKGNENGVFQLDAHTGKLTIAKSLLKSDCRVYSLEIEAKDNGLPVRSDIATLTIEVNDEPAAIRPPLDGIIVNSEHRWRVNPRNLILVICLVIIATVLAVMFLGIIIWFKRKSADHFRSDKKQQIRLSLEHCPGTLAGNQKMLESRLPSGLKYPINHEALDCQEDFEAGLMGNSPEHDLKTQTIKMLSSPDGNTYYRIPASDESGERLCFYDPDVVQNSTLRNANFHPRQCDTSLYAVEYPNLRENSQLQANAGYQALQAKRNYSDITTPKTWRKNDSLSSEGDGKKRAFNVVTSSFV